MFKLLLVATALFACAYAAVDPADAHATIVNYANEVNPDGSYNYAYDTSNRIQVQESGVGSSYASGSYSYISPEGQPIQLSYTADENGYQPKGDHLPTPPPIPEYILKALAYIEAHPFEKIQLKKRK
ncbi:pupal cuticle protein Edg-78E isoform X2 [Zeugodacus cucurbitae]|uniref:pupal cuticle protein Edg-78E isoform X2 n=1 Tax=Zeugodacus cucurbitae TaxID=28588 RepID=UPI000596AAF4|nr:pupal cuticle protein Edg-78E isoform X2 [Zeugodacus cucurbitae]